jgi:hypothetical protein
VTGTGPSLSAPSNCAFLFRKSTALGGKQGRGRMYVPGVGSNAVGANGVVTDAIQGVLQGNMDTFMSAVVGFSVSANPVLLHQQVSEFLKNGDPNPKFPADLTPTPMISCTVETQIGTQRRRMR